MSRIAIDIDLGRVTVVHSESGVIAHGADPDTINWASCPGADLILSEIAGPILHHEESHSYRRWMLYNAIVAAQLERHFVGPVLVATSTAWTKGYSEVERDAITGILPLRYKNVTRTKGGNATVTRVAIWEEPHDVRECRCMLYFHQRDPSPWKPLTQYLKELVNK